MSAARKRGKRPERGPLLPTGHCWCGCGATAERGKFFRPGHDKRAVSVVVKLEWGEIAEFLTAHGYAPGGKKWKALQAGTSGLLAAESAASALGLGGKS